MMRLIICTLAFGLLGLALTGFGCAADSRPNIIVIYSDDHGHADLGIQGVVPDIKTPHLDALARAVWSLETAIARHRSVYHRAVD